MAIIDAIHLQCTNDHIHMVVVINSSDIQQQIPCSPHIVWRHVSCGHHLWQQAELAWILCFILSMVIRHCLDDTKLLLLLLLQEIVHDVSTIQTPQRCSPSRKSAGVFCAMEIRPHQESTEQPTHPVDGFKETILDAVQLEPWKSVSENGSTILCRIPSSYIGWSTVSQTTLPPWWRMHR